MILFTGFTAFGDVASNPTERVCAAAAREIARATGERVEARVLPVAPDAIASVRLAEYTLVIATGVARGAQRLRVETEARNLYRDPQSGQCAPIDAARAIGDRIYTSPLPPGLGVALGDADSAGDYVCNDTFYRLRRQLARAYFVHVPHSEPAGDARLIEDLAGIGARLHAFRSVL